MQGVIFQIFSYFSVSCSNESSSTINKYDQTSHLTLNSSSSHNVLCDSTGIQQPFPLQPSNNGMQPILFLQIQAILGQTFNSFQSLTLLHRIRSKPETKNNTWSLQIFSFYSSLMASYRSRIKRSVACHVYRVQHRRPRPHVS